ncbi:MAG: transglutaminase-like domain-containing protein, partial [Thermodesulfobacteriota bacterium]
LSSGIGNDRNTIFFFGLFGLLGWALWMVRNRGFTPWLWLLLFGAAGVLGYAGQIGLHQLHTIVEEKVLEMMGYSGAGDEDPFQTETAIGSVGRLKLSEKIVLRVSGENGRVPPAYLRNGSYDIYSGRSWLNASRSVQKITPEQSGKEWIIHPGAKEQNGSWLTIDTRIDSQGGILPVPPGTIRLRGLSAEQVEASRSGFIRLSGVAGRIRADILADPLQPSDIAPGEIDLSVSKSQRAMLAELIGEYGLERENQAASLEAIGDYFRDHFSYTLVQKESGDHADPMSRFLHKTRAGHCEYFATATVLLCRMAGIPARYSTGWVVSEYSRLEQCYLVRARHAHAWAMVYVGGRWQVLDTTPGEWLDLEEESSSVLTPLGDLFSWGWYHLCLWWSRLLSGLGSGGLWFLVPVAAWLIYRLSRLKKKRVKGEVVESDGAVLEKRGLDSDFVLVEQFFSGVGLGRLESETPLQWCGRLEGITEQELHYHRLRKLVMCHYNHRFNPGCDAKQSRHKLKAEVDRYLALLDRERIEKMP